MAVPPPPLRTDYSEADRRRGHRILAVYLAAVGFAFFIYLCVAGVVAK